MRLYYRFMRFLSQAALVLYFRGRAYGREKFPAEGGVLLASNHQSFFDPIAVTCVLHREGHYMARDSLFRNPLFGRLIASLNAFPVRRGAADVGAVKEILRRLKDGQVVTVFPEGTRTTDGSISPLNPNSMSIAKRAGAAIAPVVIDGAFEAWPRHLRIPRPRAIHITYADPISVAEVQALPDDELTRLVTERMQAAMAESRQRRLQATGKAY